MTAVSIGDSVYAIATEEFTNPEPRHLELRVSIEVHPDFAYVCTYDGHRPQVDVKVARFLEKPVEDFDGWSELWHGPVEATITASSALWVYTVDGFKVEQLTTEAGTFGIALFHRLASLEYRQEWEPEEQHFLIIWPISELEDEYEFLLYGAER